MSLLELKKLSISYANQNLISNLSLSIDKQEVLCIIGESGCGKTTLLKCIQGLLEYQKGEIYYQGKLSEKPSEKLVPGTEGIATVYQNFMLDESLSVYYNIKRELKHLKENQQEKITLSVLKKCQLKELAHRFPREISGGQRQKLALAKALIHQPDLILLDEPFSNLDSISKNNFMDLIQELKNDLGISFIYVTHDRNDALLFADRLIIMKKGRFVLDSSIDEVFNKVDSVYAAKILGLKNIYKGADINECFDTQLSSENYYWIPFSALTYQEDSSSKWIFKQMNWGDKYKLNFKLKNLILELENNIMIKGEKYVPLLNQNGIKMLSKLQ